MRLSSQQTIGKEWILLLKPSWWSIICIIVQKAKYLCLVLMWHIPQTFFFLLFVTLTQAIYTSTGDPWQAFSPVRVASLPCHPTPTSQRRHPVRPADLDELSVRDQSVFCNQGWNHSLDWTEVEYNCILYRFSCFFLFVFEKEPKYSKHFGSSGFCKC